MEKGRDEGPGAERLRSALGGSLPPSAKALADEEALDLADSIKAARRRQSDALTDSAEQALGFIPKLLRGTVRKIVFR